MIQEDFPLIQDGSSGLHGELSLNQDILSLKHSPYIKVTDLLSSRYLLGSSPDNIEAGDYPAEPKVAVALRTPIESTVSDRSNVEQELMAVVTLGQDIALGIVKGKDNTGEEVSYISLFNNNKADNGGRAWIIDVLREGSPLTIGRAVIEGVVGQKGIAPAVSREQCTIELIKNGILTVTDRGSLNGTSVLTNSSQEQITGGVFPKVGIWSAPSPDIESLIKEKASQTKASELGKFAVSQ